MTSSTAYIIRTPLPSSIVDVTQVTESEIPETFISVLNSTTFMHLKPFVMHSALPTRPQLLVWSLQLVEV